MKVTLCLLHRLYLLPPRCFDYIGMKVTGCDADTCLRRAALVSMRHAFGTSLSSYADGLATFVAALLLGSAAGLRHRPPLSPQMLQLQPPPALGYRSSGAHWPAQLSTSPSLVRLRPHGYAGLHLAAAAPDPNVWIQDLS